MPPVHWANVSHVLVVSPSTQGWPSGITAGHTPLGREEHEPTRLRTAAPHG
jgi:hypothetical protein